MSKQIVFFYKNLADFGNVNSVASASEASNLAYLVQDRRNSTAWITTGSVDANNTTFDMDIGDIRSVTDILLVKHNFKSYTIKYWNGSSYVDFSPAISASAVTETTSLHQVASVMTNKIRVTITGTQIANSDKRLSQLILTTRIGQLNAWPIIKNAIHDRKRVASKMLSGKQNLSLSVGGFSCELDVSIWSNSSDLDIVEFLHDTADGFLTWLCGGDETQFSSLRKGYRKEDIFLSRVISDYNPDWKDGLYKTGLVIKMKLAEVTS